MKRYIKSAIEPIEDIDLESLKEIARDPDILSSDLKGIAENIFDADVLNAIVHNPNTTPEILSIVVDTILAAPRKTMYVEFVLEDIAASENLSESLAYKLFDAAMSNDQGLSDYGRNSIIINITRNPNTTESVLWHILKEEPWEAHNILNNPSVGVDFIRKMASLNNNTIHSYIAACPRTPADILIAISSDDYYTTRSNLARNPNTPTEILQELLNDEEPGVRTFAEDALRNRDSL